MAEEAAISDRPPVAYVTALIAYVALGLVLKTAVLNWIVGPLFLVLTLHLVPAACRRLVARRGLGRR